MKICLICHKTFTEKRADQKYCCSKCKEIAKKRKQRLERQLKGLCPHCGKEMDHPLSRQQTKFKISYCSKCREYYKIKYNERKKRND